LKPSALERTHKQMNIAQLFDEQAARTPNAIAAVSGDQRLTYSGLAARTNQLARYLQSVGVGRETLVGLAVDRSVGMLVAMLAILKSGGAYVPIDPSYPSARIALMIEDSQLEFLVTTERVLQGLPPHGARIISLDEAARKIASQNPATVPCPATENNLAYVIYTSGSTGRPKGVMVEHRNVINFFAGMDDAIGCDPGIWLAVTSISFDISVLELLWTLTRGFQVVIHGQESSDGIPAEILRHGITHLQSTPSLFRAHLSDPQSSEALGKLKVLLLGGEALPTSLVRSLRQAFSGELYNMYGPTETAIWSTVYAVREQRRTTPIGKPILNTQVYTLDAQLCPVPAGEAGGLFIGGAGVVRGYLNHPDLTAERFVADPFCPGGRLYRTGDYARFLPDGNLEFLGRADLQVKIRGFRVELGEIETTLERQSGVRQAVVVARGDAQGDKILIAYLVARPGESFTPESLRRALEATLPDALVPSHFIFVKKLPLTANGKVDRKALAETPIASDGSLLDGPQGEFEVFLASLWSELLGVKRISRHDNFFNLGGHSLAALKMTFRIQQMFNVDLPLRTFVQIPVLREQAAKLEELLLEQADPELLDGLIADAERNPQTTSAHGNRREPSIPRTN
jgi:amino acid adenylation domain-containing protein